MRATQPSESDPRILAIWAAKRRRFFLSLATLSAVLAAILVFWVARPRITPGVDPFMAQVLLAVAIVVAVTGVCLFELYDSSCPACAHGLMPWAQVCPRCGSRLTY